MNDPRPRAQAMKKSWDFLRRRVKDEDDHEMWRLLMNEREDQKHDIRELYLSVYGGKPLKYVSHMLDELLAWEPENEE